MSIAFFEPATAADAAAILAQASTARTPLVVQGQRTKLSGRTDGNGARGHGIDQRFMGQPFDSADGAQQRIRHFALGRRDASAGAEIRRHREDRILRSDCVGASV